jgi:hypothetical protein
MNSLTGKEERVAQGSEPNHQYGTKNCNPGRETES